MALKGFTIYQLPAVADPATELLGGLFEVEVLTGPVEGGYTNKKLTAEQLADFLPTPEAVAPTYEQLAALLQEGDGIRLTKVGGKVRISSTVQSATPLAAAPKAPTDPQVEDTANTFSGLLVPGFPAVGDYEVFGSPAFPGVVNAAAAGGDVQNGRIYSRGLTGSLLVGGGGIRVAASGNRPAGAWLLSDKPFTGTDSTPDSGAATGPARDPFDVPAAKRRAVVDTGQPIVVEYDTAYYGCEFVDEVYGPEQPAYYKCMPSAPAQAGGATVWKWFRFDVL
jgi:hypothetical protein